MKRKNAIVIGSSLLLLAVMCGLLALLLRSPEESGTPIEDEYTIYVLQPRAEGEIEQVQVSNRDGTFTFVNTDAGAAEGASLALKEAEDAGLPVSAARLAHVAASAAGLPAWERVEQGSDRLAEYGLEEPQATVRVSYTDGTAVTMAIGADSPALGGQYVTDGSGDVYFTDADDLAVFLVGLTGYLDPVITPGTSYDTSFRQIELQGGGREEPVVIRRNPEADDEQAAAESPVFVSTYQIVSPKNYRLDNVNGTANLLPVFGLVADEIVAAGDDAVPERYGLGDPYATVKAESDAGSFVLRVTAPTADGSVYLFKEGTMVIYKKDADSLPWLTLDYPDMMDTVALIPRINSISTLELETPERLYTFQVTGEDDDLAVTCNGHGVDVAAFRSYYAELISAQLQQPAEEAPETEEVLLRVAYHYRGGGRDTLEFRPGAARRVYVRLNEGGWFTTQSLYTDGLLAELPDLAAQQA